MADDLHRSAPDPAPDPAPDAASRAAPGPALPQPDPADLRGLRLLRALVTVLTAVMILGIIALVVLMARGLRELPAAAPPALPDTLDMPEGASVQAVTAGPGWWAVVTREGEILLFDAAGRLTRTIAAPELAGD